MDPYEHIVKLYDLEHDDFEDDAVFFRNLIDTGPVLEVGCGTGRIMSHLVTGGIEVHGIDCSPAMLEAARARLQGQAGAHLYLMAAEELDLPVAFVAAIFPLNVLWHLSSLDSQLAALRAVRTHLMPGGLLAIDVANPISLADRGAAGEVRNRFSSPVDGGMVQGFSSAWDFKAEQRLALSFWYDVTNHNGSVQRTMTAMDLRYTFRFELELLLRESGFTARHWYGTYDLDPYDEDSPNLVVVATVA